MSRICSVCGKGLQRGNRVSHAHNVSKRIWQPNLQSVRAIVNGQPRRIRVCTSCLKKGLVIKNSRQRRPAESGTD